MRATAIIILVLITLKVATYGQALSFKQYSVKEGLPGSTIYHALQDKNGFLWFATTQGVSRFDGRSFKNYSKEDGLPDDEVIKLYVDRHNHVWFISLLGIPSVLHNDSIISFNNCQGVRAIAEDVLEDSIVLISRVDKNNGSTYTCYRSLNKPGQWNFRGQPRTDPYGWPILRLSSSKDINFYFTDTQKSRSELTLKSSTHTEKHTFPPSGDRTFSALSFYCLTPDKEGIIFWTTDSLYRAGASGIHPVLSLRDLKLTREINSMYCENDSTLWLCTRNQGLLRIVNFLKPQRTIQSFFPKSFCTSIAKDQEHGYWITTHSDGVYYLANLHFYAASAYPDLAEKNAKCIRSLDERTVCAGFDDGNIMVIDLATMRSNLFSDWTATHKNSRILCIQRLGSGLLTAGDGGIYSFSRKGKYQKIDTLYAAKEVLVLPDSGLLIGFGAGIASTKIRTAQFRHAEERVFSGRVTCVAGIGSKYYWGTQRGVYTLSNGAIVNLSERHPQLSGIINHLDFSPDSSLWASTQEGIMVLRNDRITLISKEQGILSNICKHVSFDKDIAWVSTNKGISRINYRWTSAGLRYSISNITEEDGLTSNDVNQTTPGGKYIWAATARGITFFAKDYVSRSVLHPLINITRVVAGEKALPANDTIVLKYPENTLRIELAGISYRSGRQIHYEYRLRGLDDHWKKLVNNTVEFSALPFGEFVFEVLAVDRWGEKSDASEKITIINIPPFWKSTGFVLFTYLGLAGFLGAGFYTFHKTQHRKKEQQYQLKKKMHTLEMKALQAQINPHFIFNCLTSIQYHILRSDIRSANNYLHKFSTLIRQNLQHSTVSTLLVREEIKTLSLYLELERLRMGDRMEYALIAPEKLQHGDLHIPSMIIQPYVENAIKHGISPLKDRKGMILITFAQTDATIECSIEDNGPGINATRENRAAPVTDHVSMGTTITASRIQTINATQQCKITLKVTDKRDAGLPDSGTIVCLSFPILTD